MHPKHVVCNTGRRRAAKIDELSLRYANERRSLSAVSSHGNFSLNVQRKLNYDTKNSKTYTKLTVTTKVYVRHLTKSISWNM